MEYKSIPLILFLISISSAFEWRKINNQAFKEGEVLEYIIKWGALKVGKATMSLSKNLHEIDGRKAYHLKIETRSLPFFDTFYKVRDKNESWIDVESICSLRYREKIQEGKHRRKREVKFDHVSGEFICMPENSRGKISPFVNDVISAIYYLRTQTLEVGKMIKFDVYEDKKICSMEIEVAKKKKLKTPIGEIECVLARPTVKKSSIGIFKPKGKLWIWFTNDRRKIPVKMKLKFFIGSLTAKIIKVSGLN